MFSTIRFLRTRKDYHYVEESKSFYKIHTIPLTWADAKRVCALEGASLGHPDNDDEAQALISFWKKLTPKSDECMWGFQTYWLKEYLRSLMVRKSISEVYNNRQSGQPDNFGDGQDCVYIFSNEGLLDDSECDKKFPFICKKSLQSLEWNYQCNMPNLSSYNKNNYKLHTTPLNWTEAYAMCQLEQSNLAVISNQLEADYLVQLTESTRKPRVKENYKRGIYHLGFHNRLNAGWQTVRGTRMSIDRDAWFDNYEPDGDIYQECGSMFFNGRLVNTACDMRSFFICEHEVDNFTPVANSFIDSERPILQPYVGGGIE